MKVTKKELKEYFESALEVENQKVIDAIEYLNEFKYFMKQVLVTTRSEMKERCGCFINSEGVIQVGVPLYEEKDPGGYHTNIDLEKMIILELRCLDQDEVKDHQKDMAIALEKLAHKIRNRRIKVNP